MKLSYRKLLIGAAIASVLGITGAVYAHGGPYGGTCQQDAQAQSGCGFGGPGKGMMEHGAMMGPGAMMGHGAMMSHSAMMGHGSMMGHDSMRSGMQRGMGYGMVLDLSDEQRAEMGKISQEILPLMGELHGKMQANHAQMRALRLGGSQDQAAIETLADQKGDLIAEMIKLRASLQVKMEAVLTDEQREQMRQRGWGMGPMGRGHMGD